MAQTWADVRMFEQLLNLHPELASIAELGTGQGALSRYLYMQACTRGMEFLTFDVVPPDQEVPGWQRRDVLREVDDVVGQFVRPVLVICDNGNKPAEMSLYAPKLCGHDLLAVHDWGTEVQPEDVPFGLVPIHEDLTFSMMRVFRRR